MLAFFKLDRSVGLIFLILLSLASCNEKDETAQLSISEMPVDRIRFDYLALGDSYTIGTALPDSSRNYPNQLVERLNEDSLLEGSEPDIVAFGGWRTDELIDSLDSAGLSKDYDLVSLLIGVNNQYQNQPLDVYGMEFELLLKTAIQYAENDTDRVFVLSIPDYGVTPFGQNDPDISEEIDIYNDINQDITESYGVSYFNITDISRMAENNPDLIAPDNLHPSGDMYELWVDEILEDVKSKLYE